jgi:hypothetical protein
MFRHDDLPEAFNAATTGMHSLSPYLLADLRKDSLSALSLSLRSLRKPARKERLV